jgi:hypothetical protein
LQKVIVGVTLRRCQEQEAEEVEEEVEGGGGGGGGRRRWRWREEEVEVEGLQTAPMLPEKAVLQRRRRLFLAPSATTWLTSCAQYRTL